MTLLSVTEGDDKPAKYPVIFRASDLVLLSKTDLLDLLDDFDPVRAAAAVRALGRETPTLHVASRRRPAMSAWLAWLEQELAAFRPLTHRRVSMSQPPFSMARRQALRASGSAATETKVVTVPEVLV